MGLEAFRSLFARRALGCKAPLCSAVVLSNMRVWGQVASGACSPGRTLASIAALSERLNGKHAALAKGPALAKARPGQSRLHLGLYSRSGQQTARYGLILLSRGGSNGCVWAEAA